MQNILVTGSNGQLGRSIQEVANDFPDISFVFADKKVLDITKQGAVDDFFDRHSFDFCINTAAYTAVDKAEEEKDLAYLVNVTAVKYLAKACKKQGTKLIHFSTDYVYADYNRPLLETDDTNPLGIYSRTKLEGELVLRDILPDSCVIRTSWVYSPYGHNFVKTMLRLSKERKTLSVVYDQIGTPTYAPDLAVAILSILSKPENAEKLSGTFNYSNEGVASWYDFAKAIFEITESSCQVIPITSDGFPTAAKRPFYSVLNKQKFKDTFGLSIRHWREALEDM